MQVGCETGVVIVFTVEVDALSVVRERMRQGVETKDIGVAERGKENKATLRVAIDESVMVEEGGKPNLVGRLFVPPVIVENMSVRGLQRVAITAVEGT